MPVVRSMTVPADRSLDQNCRSVMLALRMALWRNRKTRRIQTPVPIGRAGSNPAGATTNASWCNWQHRRFWFAQFRFEPWRGSRSADHKRTLPRDVNGSMTESGSVRLGSNPGGAANAPATV